MLYIGQEKEGLMKVKIYRIDKDNLLKEIAQLEAIKDINTTQNTRLFQLKQKLGEKELDENYKNNVKLFKQSKATQDDLDKLLYDYAAKRADFLIKNSKDLADKNEEISGKSQKRIDEIQNSVSLTNDKAISDQQKLYEKRINEQLKGTELNEGTIMQVVSPHDYKEEV